MIALLAGLAWATCGDEPVLGELVCTDIVVGDLLDGDPHGIDDQYTCGSPYPDLYQTGPEDVWTWICPAAGDVRVVLSDTTCDLDLYLLDGTCDPTTGCLAGDTSADLARAEAFTTCLAPGDVVHVVVEGYGLAVPFGDCLLPEAGTYTLSFDLEEGVCDEMVVESPIPGESGALNTLDVTGGTPGLDVIVMVGLAPGSTEIPRCPGLFLSASELVLFGRGTTDDDRVATIERFVPEVASGVTVTMHAVEQESCRRSEPLVFAWP